MGVKSFTLTPWKEPAKVSVALQAGQILVVRGSESKMSGLWDFTRSRTPVCCTLNNFLFVYWLIVLEFIKPFIRINQFKIRILPGTKISKLYANYFLSPQVILDMLICFCSFSCSQRTTVFFLSHTLITLQYTVTKHYRT